MQPKLFTTRICPYAQRCVIVLLEKGIDHQIVYITPGEYPEGFEKISPQKKVPVLVTHEGAIVDSVAINEYLEDAYPEPLLPQGTYERAWSRSWIEFCGPCMSDFGTMILARTASEFEAARHALMGKLDLVEAHCLARHMAGTKLSLVDCTFAPLLQRLWFLHDRSGGVMEERRHPGIVAWGHRLMASRSVIDSLHDSAMASFLDFLQARDSHVACMAPLDHATAAA